MKKEEIQKLRKAIKKEFEQGNYNLPLIASHFDMVRSSIQYHIRQDKTLGEMWERYHTEQREKKATERAKIIEDVKALGIRATAEKHGYGYKSVAQITYEHRDGKKMVAVSKQREKKSGYYVPYFPF